MRFSSWEDFVYAISQQPIQTPVQYGYFRIKTQEVGGRLRVFSGNSRKGTWSNRGILSDTDLGRAWCLRKSWEFTNVSPNSAWFLEEGTI